MEPQVSPNTSMKKVADSPSEPDLARGPEVSQLTWMAMEDLAAALTNVLQGASVMDVEKCLVQYVEDSIEPAGWRAVWRASLHSSITLLSLQPPRDLYVDVVHVSREKLQADVKIVGPLQDSSEDEERTEGIVNIEVCVPLLELYPLAEQENEVLDMRATTEVVEIIRFFYDYIWQAWDTEEEQCYYDNQLIKTRLKLYRDIEDNHIPAAIGSELRDLIKKASEVYREIKRVEANEEGVEQEIDQRDFARLIHLHKQMEQLKYRFEMLQIPAFRELSTHHISPEQYDGITLESTSATVKVVVTSLSIPQLAHYMALLPDVLKALPQVGDDALCQTFSSLQVALDVAKKDDVVVVLPGQHSIHHLGLISTGGAIIGVGEGVVVVGRSGTGDVMLDTTGSFTLNNLTLRPSPGQVAIVHHQGKLFLSKVTIQDGRGGVVGLGDTESQIQDVTVQGCSSVGLDFRESARAIISSCTVDGCDVGLQLEEGAKVCLVDSKVERNDKYGVFVVWPRGSDLTKFADIPKDSLIECLLDEYHGNSITSNKEDDVRVAEACSPPRSNPNSSPCFGPNSLSSSSASLDSGFELIENVSG